VKGVDESKATGRREPAARGRDQKAFTADPFRQKLSVEHFPTARVDGTSVKQGPGYGKQMKRCTSDESARVGGQTVSRHSQVAEDLLLPIWLTSIIKSTKGGMQVAPAMDIGGRGKLRKGNILIQDLSKRGSKRDMYIRHLYRSWHVGQRF
jgi:hypothetical protein